MRKYKSNNRDQLLLFPPNLNDWLPAKHPARFVVDAIQLMDLRAFDQAYESDKGGAPPYDPAIVLAVLLYGYMMGTTSSRKLERATINDIGFRFLTANQALDHDTIANFRATHSALITSIFPQVVQMAMKAGMVRLGHVAIDGTKVRANASKWNRKTRDELESERRRIREYLGQCDKEDEAEDREFGKGNNGYMMPEFLSDENARKQWIKEQLKELSAEEEISDDDNDDRKSPPSPLQAKLEKIETTLAALDEQEQREQQNDPKGKLRRKRERKRGSKQTPQINQTDFDSRLMRFPNGRYDESYNCQIAVDDWNGLIVAAAVTTDPADQRQLGPMVSQVQSNTDWLPENVTADNSYFNTQHIEDKRFGSVQFFVRPNKSSHEKRPDTKSQRMRERLSTEFGAWIYEQRKATVEPVFGMIKHARGLRQFNLRGKRKVQAEWSLWCTAHNLLKLLKVYGTPELVLT